MAGESSQVSDLQKQSNSRFKGGETAFSLKDKSDDSILLAIAKELEKTALNSLTQLISVHLL